MADDEGEEGQDGERDSILSGGGRNTAAASAAAAAAADPTMTSGWSGLLLWLWTGLEEDRQGEEGSLPEFGGSECEALVQKEGACSAVGTEGR